MIETEIPRFFSKHPSEATLIPFPTEDATPPVTKIYFDILTPLPGALILYLSPRATLQKKNLYTLHCCEVLMNNLHKDFFASTFSKYKWGQHVLSNERSVLAPLQ